MRPGSRPVLALLVTGTLAAGSYASLSDAATRTGAVPATVQEALDAQQGLLAPRAPSTADRYAPANGCFALKSVASGKLVTRAGTGFAATGTAGEPFGFEPIDLGKYLLLGSQDDFLATAADPLPTQEGLRFLQGYARFTPQVGLVPAESGAPGLPAVDPDPVFDPLVAGTETGTAPVEGQVRGDGVEAAAAPSASAEWVLKQVGSAFVLQQAFSDGSEADPGPVDPPISATLVSSPEGVLTAGTGALTSPAAQFTLVPTSGCKALPEAPDTISGPIRTGATPYEQTQGYMDPHLHLMAFEFIGGKVRCGRPWHPYGVAQALVDCPDHGPGGYGSALEDVVSGKTPGSGHDTEGYPKLVGWPQNDSLTHEAVYYQWLERAWQGGLRMFTDLLVDNSQLCQAYPLKKNACDEMSTVRLEVQRTHELARYIDAQNGGPGRGWFRVVTDPMQARRVINAGKLAVVLGIEVSRPLGCREFLGRSSCTDADITKGLDEVYALGVRQMEMTNKFDNAFTGVTGDGGQTGLVVGAVGNLAETGHTWKMGTCTGPEADVRHDKQQTNFVDDGHAEPARDGLFAGVLQLTGTSGVAPVYPAGPHCNTIGLTAQGEKFLEGLVQRGMIFDPDHMSAAAREKALDLLADRGYNGVISSHSWADDANYYKVLSMGGVVYPHASGSSGFVGKWSKLRQHADPRFLYGIGFGSDINGFSQQGGPRNPAPGQGVTYPFTALGGATVMPGKTGTRTWDINTDGVDTYGQYVDWVEDVRVQAGAAGPAFMKDLANGAEAYLQMWERAIGVVGDSCRADVADLTKADLKSVKKGMTPEQVLAALGQPSSRVGTAFTYCGPEGTATVRFNATGTVAAVDL